MKWLLGAIALVLASCSINHHSGEFTTCDKQSDCLGSQQCIGGVCQLPGGQDSGPPGDGKPPDAGKTCPAQCTSCRLDTMECTVDCAVSPATCNGQITCPEGFSCNILCSVTNSCRNGI